jgi:Lrp/AsnC family transcriptional regulator, leucine-responsive regulatory protein
MIDEIDSKILKILQKNARTPNAEIARQVGLVPSAVLERIRRLEERGVIRGYEAQLNAKELGLGLLAFVFVRTEDFRGEDKAAAQLAQIPEVLEVHHIAGEDCFLVKVRATDTDDLGRLLREKIAVIETVSSTRTTIVLQTARETAALPIRQGQEDE